MRVSCFLFLLKAGKILGEGWGPIMSCLITQGFNTVGHDMSSSFHTSSFFLSSVRSRGTQGGANFNGYMETIFCPIPPAELCPVSPECRSLWQWASSQGFSLFWLQRWRFKMRGSLPWQLFGAKSSGSFFWCCLGIIPVGAQDLTLAHCSGITPSRVLWTICGASIRSRWVMCKASALLLDYCFHSYRQVL